MMLFEAEFLPGLQTFVDQELKRCLNIEALNQDQDSLIFRYGGPIEQLFDLKLPVAIYQVEYFDIPRPKALLGHQHLTRLLTSIRLLRQNHSFETFRFSAAGKQSSVFERLRKTVEQETGLTAQPDEADLLMRVRPARSQKHGWEALLRITPRPLATRAWRVCDMPGAVNATIAAAMVELTQPAKSQTVLNLMCGSGTLLIERAARLSAKALVGIDNDESALNCAKKNLHAANLQANISLEQMDAADLDFDDQTFDVLLADLPWGQHIGSHEVNIDLYPAILKEAARVARVDAKLVLLSHEINLMEEILAMGASQWQLSQMIKLYQGGLHPRIYVLEQRT